MFLLFFLKFIAFPSRKDSLFYNKGTIEDVELSASGSFGLFHHDNCFLSFPNQTFIENQVEDWCSSVPEKKGDKPWIEYHFKNEAVKLKGFSVRSGCCYRACCSIDPGKVTDKTLTCCCRLYSFSLQGSNDNITWKVIHEQKKKTDFLLCSYKTFEFDETESFRFVRFVLDEPYPGCQNCMQINQIDLYGERIKADFQDDEEESISIIGKLKKSSE